jgi:Uma2 family endonuclease
MELMVAGESSVRLRGLRRTEFERLVEAGDLDGEPVELLDGALVHMSPQGSRHAGVIHRLGQILTIALAGRYEVSQEKPLALDELSEPEPDIAIIDPRGLDAHPSTAHAVIEVAQTSQAVDLGWKADAYSRAGIPLYWVIDLQAQTLVVHTDASPEGYRSITTCPPTDVMDVLGVPVTLADLLAD